jgi:hypothetical protein
MSAVNLPGRERGIDYAHPYHQHQHQQRRRRRRRKMRLDLRLLPSFGILKKFKPPKAFTFRIKMGINSDFGYVFEIGRF